VPAPTPQISASASPAPPRAEIVVVPDPVVVKRASVEPAKPQPPKTEPATPAPPELLTDAETAIAAGDLARARDDYQSALRAPRIPHATLLKIGEGLYRARDFGGAVQAFQRLGPFDKGEEAYGYYYAVALYETGNYREAK